MRFRVTKLFHRFKTYKFIDDRIVPKIGWTAGTLVVAFPVYQYLYDRRAFRTNIYISQILTRYLYAILRYSEARPSDHDFCGRTLLKLALLNGGIFIKVGQHLSAMSHVVPKDITNHLRILQTECSEQPIENIKLVLREDLEELFDHFTDFEEKPLGTASIAQVHKAKLDGKEVVLKVQHLDIVKNSAEDIQLLELWSARTSRWFRENFKFDWLVKEVKVLLADELDFYKEATNATEARNSHKHLPWLVIPRIYHEYTTNRILVMDYEPGFPIDDVEFYKKNNIDASRIVEKIGYLFNEMTFLTGFLHADPHAGNLKIRMSGPIGPVQIILQQVLFINYPTK